jgi:hypothetical protein
VGRVAGEEQAAVPHRLADVAAHRDDALLGDRALLQPEAVAGHPRLQLLPDPLIRPVLDRVGRVALEVHPLDLGRAGADQREAALVVRVDQLSRGRRRLGQNAEPAERVDPEVVAADRVRDGTPADPVGAVTAADEVAEQLACVTLRGREADRG